MQHWFGMYEMQQARLREDRDRAMARQAAQRAAREAREAERRTLLVALGGDPGRSRCGARPSADQGAASLDGPRPAARRDDHA